MNATHRPSPRRVPAAPRHAALFRNDRGGLEPRLYATPADAAQVARERELPTPAEIEAADSTKEVRHTVFAKRLGISPRLVRDYYKRGDLPGAKEHSAYILMVPLRLLNLARIRGLLAVARMARAGLL